MRILVISQYFPPDMGGGSARAHNAIKGLLKLGHKVTVIAGFPHYPLGDIPKEVRSKAMIYNEMGGLHLIRVWLPSIPHRGLARRIVLFISFMISSLFPLFCIGETQVVWAANPNFFAYFPAMLYGLIKRCPVVRNVDDLWPEVLYELKLINSAFLRKLFDFTSKVAYQLPNALTPISPFYATHIQRKYRVAAQKIHVIEVGVDTDIFNLGESAGRDNESFIVMYSGILGPGYNFDVVLNAAKKLSSHTKIHFIIRGLGELASFIKEKIKTAEIKNVTLSTTYLKQKELISVLRSADVFLLPLSRAGDKGLPTKIFEYQAIGKPIICCSNGPSADYINETGSGIVIKLQNADQLGRAVLRVYNNPRMRKEMGIAGSKHVQEALSCNAIGQRIAKVFSKVSMARNT